MGDRAFFHQSRFKLTMRANRALTTLTSLSKVAAEGTIIDAAFTTSPFIFHQSCRQERVRVSKLRAGGIYFILAMHIVIACRTPVNVISVMVQIPAASSLVGFIVSK